MALIPPDAGVRLRMQTESSLLQPATPVKEIPSDLPELQPGQAFTARIQEALPENTYKALVAGRLLTLQLPEGAKAGDTLELVVIDRTPRLLIAERLPTQAPAAGAEPYPYATLSRAAQMVGQLLLPEGEAPQPAPLNRGEPLLPQAPVKAADLVPVLARAVSESGLFYEAHQAQWVAGRLPPEQLAREPQARHAPPPGPGNPSLPGEPEVSARETPSAASLRTPATPTAPTLLQSLFGSAEAPETPPPQAQPQAGLAVPDELRSLVQQQLDAVATQRLAWHGEVWPGQTMDWEIRREEIQEREAGTDGDDAGRWRTTLRLTMPRLGTVDATLQLAGNGLRIRLDATEDAAAADLSAGMAELTEALSAAGLGLLSFEVRHG